MWLDFRFCPGVRDGEVLLWERGGGVSYEALRQWRRTFAQQSAHHLPRCQPRPGNHWHLDELALPLKGEHPSLWRTVEQEGDVRPVETPGGEVVTTLHRGPYDRLSGAHTAIHDWCGRNGKRIGGFSWEIYGDWTDDPNKLETTVVYLLDV